MRRAYEPESRCRLSGRESSLMPDEAGNRAKAGKERTREWFSQGEWHATKDDDDYEYTSLES